MNENGTIKKMVKKLGIFMSLLIMILTTAPWSVIQVDAVTGYQWIDGVPDEILYEIYNASEDEIDDANGYFSAGVLTNYPLIGYNCSGTEKLERDTPVCEQYYYFGTRSDSAVFHNFCGLLNSECGAGESKILWLLNGLDSACADEAFAPTGNGRCSSKITINDNFDVKQIVESEYNIDGSNLPDGEQLEEEAEGAPVEEDPGGDPIDEEDETAAEPCYDAGEIEVFGLFSTGLPANGMRWIVCEVSQLVGQAIDRINEGIANLLDFNPTSPNSGDSLQNVWSNILRFANILFVIAFLIMIISTALDLGIFSNYTVKKLLPRLIIAAILANLSWGISTVLIDVTNAVGGAVNTIILSPLQGSGDALNWGASEQFQAAATQADGAGVLQSGVVVALGTLIYFTLASAGAILLPVIAAAFVAALIAFGALLLRRIIIILLIIFAPLAFALWALPNGEKIFQRWWKIFTQMLLMYPMIMALFASGLFISQLLISSSSSAGLGPVTAATAFLAIVLPYLLIPTLFKLAGGVLGNLTGMINDRSKGIIDRSRKWRDEGSQWGRRKQLKAQRKNFTGHEKLLHSMDAEKLAGSEWLQRRRRAQGLGRNWAQGDMAKETQRNFLAKSKAAVSKEQLEAASYLSMAVAGGIDSKGIDGKGRQFLVTRKDGTEFMTGKDAAVAEAWLGAKVQALEETLDAGGNIKYGKEIGTLFDGSEASQRAAGSIAGQQALAPVIDTVRNGGDSSMHGWKRTKRDGTAFAPGDTYAIASLYDQYRAAPDGSEAQAAAAGANGVLAEVKGTYAQNLTGKMPSFVKGNSLAFQGVQAGSLAGFHENEVSRMIDYVSNDLTGAEQSQTWARIGQSVKQIVEEPAKYNMSPVSLARLKRDYDAHVARSGGVAPNPELDRYMARINRSGTLS